MNKYSSICLSMAILILVPIFSCIIPFTTQADEFQKHRFVVLVYDDSGSMSYQCNSWEKANYSLQALTGLLDREDQLLVVRMSTPEQVSKIELGNSQRQSSINGIRNTPNANGSTPFAALQTATKQLAGVGREYECWLVLLSDGEIYKNTNENETLSVDEFSTFMETFMQDTCDQGVNCIFLAIGDQVPQEFKTAWNSSTGQKVLEARNPGEIIDRMNQISAVITSRDPDNAVDSPLEVNYIGSDKVEIAAPFPLRRLTIFSQAGKDAGIQMKIAESESGDTLQITGPYTIGTPVGGSDHVAGRIIHIQDSRSVMPAGKYQLVFGEDISGQHSQIKYLAELAVDFACGLYKTEGDKLKQVDSSSAFTGDEVQARVKIIDADSGKALDLSKITGLIEVVMDIDGGSPEPLNIDLSSNAFVSRAFKLQEGKLNARFTMTITGWYQATKYCGLEVKDQPIRNLGLSIEPSEWRERLDQLENAEPICVTPTIDGRPMTENEFLEFSDKLQIDTKAKIRVEMLNEHFEIYPELASLGMAFTPTGRLEAELLLNGRIAGEEAKGDLVIVIEDIPWWIKYRPWIIYPIIILIGLWYINGIIRKPRFARDEAYINHETTSIVNGRPSSASNPFTERLAGGWFQRWLVPYRPESMAIAGITFIAMPHKSCIKISRDSLENELDAEGTRIFASGIKLDKEDLRSDIILNNSEELLIERRVRREKFKYVI